ncbi:aldose epimerase family protein [Stakelama saccharophila]|uniref:Aldose 1-epimerase n=1 Tax=Stakelama saccharophila TaxID=3075605 RepID=A0ABZ0B681_9SPHN|nr:aldose epimerase family protein [Stakelama sp. W311]WNO52911.1 aldose epimerase family protein [Stakelama sp. W311]
MTELRRESFGTLPGGRVVEAITLSNGHGIEATIITYGATLQRLMLPDRRGEAADVALGYPDLQRYLDEPQYLGATIGRYANRIAGGCFTLDGETHRIATNEGANVLHGGPEGFDKRLWDVVETAGAPEPSVTLRLESADGDMGFPGMLSVTARFSLDDAGRLTIAYAARTDAPTIVNLTNHTYWNLAGEGSGSALGHLLAVAADAITPVGHDLIPTGEVSGVAGTSFDFRTPRRIAEHIRNADEPQIAMVGGYDHNFVLSPAGDHGLRRIAELREPESGRGFELWSDQPGLQFYTANHFDGTIAGKSDRLYRQGDAVALEPQRFPDTPNRPDFGSARLDPGQLYRNTMVYRFITGGR